MQHQTASLLDFTAKQELAKQELDVMIAPCQLCLVSYLNYKHIQLGIIEIFSTYMETQLTHWH